MFLQVLHKARHGTVLLTLPDGRVENCGVGMPQIRVTLFDWRALDLMFDKGDLGLAEAIIEGLMIVDNVANLVEWACRNDQDLARTLYGKWYGTFAARIRQLFNRADREGAQRNIEAHYDLGNEFYQLWLDPTMSYSSAIFPTPFTDLEKAQTAKYDRIIDSLNIRAGDHVLEIGCGWGGFFSRAVERTGCRVTAVMNSPRQASHNATMIRDKKLLSHVELRKQDYRDIDGRFDKIVSIEMIEAVGEKYWGTYFDKIASSLKPGGQTMIQGITIREDLFYSYRKTPDFIQRYVFPGGMLPTSQAIRALSEDRGMMLVSSFDFADCYARTLHLWSERFSKVLPEVRTLGFSEKFIRMWSLYLGYCEGAFRAGRINVAQFHLGV